MFYKIIIIAFICFININSLISFSSELKSQLQDNSTQESDLNLAESLSNSSDEEAETKENPEKNDKLKAKEEKAKAKTESLLKKLKIAKNLVFEDELMQVYLIPKMLFYPAISDKNIYNFYILVITNKTQKDLYLNGDIFNKVSKAEAKTNINQLAETLIWRNNTARRSATQNSYGFTSYYPENTIKKRQNILLKSISTTISDNGFKKNIGAEKDAILGFVLQPDSKVKPALAMQYSVLDKDLKTDSKLLAQNIDVNLAKDVLEKPDLYTERAFIDGKLSEFKKDFI